ncbi:MAG: AsmA family protein, partial [Deltaproteobacteria bacterium]|nr:AsmA family protein [Deltaproteobacteria bacterium]
MKKFFLIFCALLLVTVCAVSVGVYVYWDTNRQKQFLENTATSLLHRQVHIRGAHLRLLPQTHMVLEQVTIKDQDGNADAVSIDQVRVSLSLRHLLTGLVYVRSLTIDRPRTTLVLSPDRLSVSALIHAFISERSDREAGQEGRFDNFQIFLETVRIQNGAIILKKPPPFSNTIVSRVVEFDLTTGQISTAKPTSVKFTCRLQENGNVGTIRIQGKLGPLAKESLLKRTLQCDGLLEAKDIAVSSLLPYLPEAWKIESLHGVVDGRVLFQGYLESDLDISADIDVENLAVKDSRLFKNGITAKKARLISSIKRIDKKIIIPRITVVLPELTAEGTFLLDYTDTAIIRTEWKTESFNYRDVLRYLPWSRWSPQASHLMKEKIVAGIVDTVSFSYHQSGVHSDKVIAAEGRVCFRDFSLTIADDLPPLESLGGELRLKEGELIVTTATGKFGSTEIKQCSISLSPSDFLDISAACNLDLSDLHKLLRSHIMPVSVHRRVEKLTSMSGNGRLSLDFSCPLKELSELTVGGKLQLENAAIDYKLFRGKATNLFGTIQFTPYLITFTDIQGYWLNSPVTCNGTIENYRTRQSEIKVQVTSKRALTDDLASTFFPWEGAYGTGLLPIEINFFCRGYRKETFYFEGVTIPTDISLFFPAFPHPFTQVAGTVRFSSTGLRFSDMSCKTGDSELTFFGTWQNLRQPIITGTIEGTVINFLDFIQPPKAGGKPPPPFTLDAIEINIKEGRIKDLTASDLETNLQYRNGVFFIPFLTAKKATYRHLMTFTNITTLKEQEPVPISYENGVA